MANYESLSHGDVFAFMPQVFVESLDRAFENVCELDLVFHFDEVRCWTLFRANIV
jgi:hypothetical protein